MNDAKHWHPLALAFMRRGGSILSEAFFARLERRKRRKPAKRAAAPEPSWADRSQPREVNE